MADGGTIGELTGACSFRSMALGLTKEKAREIEGATADSPDPRGASEEQQRRCDASADGGSCGGARARHDCGLAWVKSLQQDEIGRRRRWLFMRARYT